MANGLSDATAIEVTAWLNVMQRQLERDVALGTVAPCYLFEWDRWSAQTRGAMGLPALPPVADEG
jgi:hypothetical protein